MSREESDARAAGTDMNLVPMPRHVERRNGALRDTGAASAHPDMLAQPAVGEILDSLPLSLRGGGDRRELTFVDRGVMPPDWVGRLAAGPV